MCVRVRAYVHACVKKCRVGRGGESDRERMNIKKETVGEDKRGGVVGRRCGGVDAVALAMVVTSRAVWLSLATRHDVTQR